MGAFYIQKTNNNLNDESEENTMATNENTCLYRGNCEKLQEINKVEIDIAALAMESIPQFDGEPVRWFFPVRSQISWFRLKNGDKGNIQLEIVKADDYIAVVKATIFVDGVAVSSAHGSANTSEDSASSFKLIEAAETRAIGRALDFAGYGCQLDLKTFDGSQPDSAAPQSGNPAAGSEEEQSPAMPEAEVIPQPGVMNGKHKVDANAPSRIIDIHELESDTEPEKPKSRRKPKTQKTAEAEADTATAEHSDSAPVTAVENAEEPAEAAPSEEPEADTAAADGDSAPAPMVENAEEPPVAPDETVSETASATISEAVTKFPTDAGTVNLETPEKSAEELVWNYIESESFSSDPIVLDPRFFGEENTDPFKAFFIEGRKTKMLNHEIQLALAYLQEHPDVIYQLKYPATQGAFAGLTFGEIVEAKGGDVVKQAAAACQRYYAGKKAPEYAAALLLAEKFDA